MTLPDLLNITGELLNMTQVERGTSNLASCHQIQWTWWITRWMRRRRWLSRKNIKIEINSEENLPKVLADNEKTAWCWPTLFPKCNSLFIWKQYSVDCVESMNSMVNFIVKEDTGQGIAPQYKTKIFGPLLLEFGNKKKEQDWAWVLAKNLLKHRWTNHVKVTLVQAVYLLFHFIKHKTEVNQLIVSEISILVIISGQVFLHSISKDSGVTRIFICTAWNTKLKIFKGYAIFVHVNKALKRIILS